MPRSYSADLRERALLACEAGARPVQVAAQFRVGLSTVYLWRKQAREDGRRIFHEVQHVGQQCAVQLNARQHEPRDVAGNDVNARCRDVAADATQCADGDVVAVERDDSALLAHQACERTREGAFARPEVGPGLAGRVADTITNEVGSFENGQ